MLRNHELTGLCASRHRSAQRATIHACATNLGVDLVIRFKVPLHARHDVHVHVRDGLTGIRPVLRNGQGRDGRWWQESPAQIRRIRARLA